MNISDAAVSHGWRQQITDNVFCFFSASFFFFHLIEFLKRHHSHTEIRVTSLMSVERQMDFFRSAQQASQYKTITNLDNQDEKKQKTKFGIELARQM